MSIETPVDGIIIPSSPADREKIKKALQEISDAFTRIEAEKDLIKEIVEVVAEEHGLPKKFVNKLANTFHKRSLEKQISETEALELAYENIVGAQQQKNEFYDEE